MNFGDIKAEVQTLLIDTPASVQSLVPKFVNRALKKIQTKHDFKDMEFAATFTTTVDTRPLTPVRPSNWKKLRGGRGFLIRELGDVRPLNFASNQQNADLAYGTNVDLDFGEPRQLVEDGLTATKQFLVYPYPDGNSDYDDGEYRIIIPYWGYIPAMTDDADTNWFTDNSEEYLIYQATGFGFYANEDEKRGDVWLQLAAMERKDAILADKERRLSETHTLPYYTGANPPHVSE